MFALLFVTVAFSALVVWVLLPRNRQLERYADIVFDDEPCREPGDDEGIRQ